METTFLLADDHKIIRDGLRMLLAQHEGFRVIGEAENGREAVRLALELMPHIVVMDIGMPELNGIDATRHIMSECPETKIIALSMYTDRRFVLDMFQVGAAGYLLKSSAFAELVKAVETVRLRKRYVSPEIAEVILSECLQQSQAHATSQPFSLTSREREVIQLLAEGKTSKQIAGILGLTVLTTETYRRQIMKKLDLHTVAELTKYAIREGITPLEA